MGVAHQYCGVLGKNANGQVAVTACYVDPYHAWPVSGQLYLDEEWCQDAQRRARADIPKEATFQTRLTIALVLIDEALQWGVPFTIVGGDGGYGDNPTFLEGLEARKLHYIVGVHTDFGVRRPEEVAQAAKTPLPFKKKSGRPGRHPHPVQIAPLYRADAELAAQPEEACRTITWREGSDGPLTKQFLALRVHRATGDFTGPEGWLVGERPLPGKEGEKKFYFSDLPVDAPLARLAELVHRRPVVERCYQDGKGFTGLDEYAARKWDSFYHHLAIEMLALSFLALQLPPVANPVIVVEPRPVAAPDEPVFPSGGRTNVRAAR